MHSFAQTNIQQAEYFIDTDPGFGNATQITVSPAADIAEAVVNIPLTVIASGFHNLFLRSKDANGQWSVTNKLPFYKVNVPNAALIKVVKAEYFIDTDPGFGTAVNIPVTSSSSIEDQSVIIPINNVSDGFHNLFLRTQDDLGGWSISNRLSFFKVAAATSNLVNVVQSEYFIDVDPGFGMANNISITPASNIADKSVIIPIGSVAEGFHNLFVRSRDLNGNWSISNKLSFFKVASNLSSLPNVIKAEYFIDIDPGFGMANDISVTSGVDIADRQIVIPIGNVASGFHNIFVRTKDASESWSVTNKLSFFKVDASSINTTKIIQAEYFIDVDPGFGSATAIPITPSTNIADQQVVVPVSNVSEGFHNLYVRSKDLNGNWSISNKLPFYKVGTTSGNLPNIVKAEYFIDVDPGFGLAKSISVTQAANINNQLVEVDLTGITAGFHVFYLRSLDADGKWSITNLDTFTISSVVIPTVSVGILQTEICAGSNLSVPFTVNTRFGAANTFVAQLSDAGGGFNNPTVIGSLTSDTSGVIACTVPANAGAGTAYRIRILSNSPITTSRTSADQITVKRIPEVNYAVVGAAEVCIGNQNYSLSATETATTYNWQLVNNNGLLAANNLSASVNWNRAGNDSLLVTATNTCGSGSIKKLPVIVFASLPAFTPSISVNGRTLTAPLLTNAQGVTGYRWYKNGNLLSGQNSNTYVVPDNETGSYRVALFNPCGIGTLSDSVAISIVRNNQNIVFNSIGPKIFGDPSFIVLATASSGLPVVYSIVSGPGTINGDVVTITGGGVITIRAYQAGNDNFNEAQAFINVTINKAPATITLSNLLYTYDGTGKRATAVTNPVGLGVNINYNGSPVLPVNGGSYTVNATISSNDYQGSADSVLVIQKTVQTISLQSISNKSFNDAPFSVVASASSGLPVTFSILTVPATGVATINGNVITILGGGSVTVTATQSGNQNYEAASTQTSFTISPPLAKDISVFSMVSPIGGCSLGAQSSITVKLRNSGTEAASGFPISYSINSGALVTETVTGSIAAGQELLYTFNSIGNFPNAGQLYDIKIFTALAGDERLSNDTLTQTVRRFTTFSSRASSDTSICKGETAVLKAFGGGTYNWAGISSSSAIAVSPIVTTSYVVTITDPNGCATSKDTVKVTVIDLPQVNAGADQTILRGSSVTLVGNGEGSLLWSNGIADSINIVSPNNTTSYVLSATSTVGCKAFDTVQVVVNFSALNVSPGLYNFGSVVKDSSAIKNITITNTGTLVETVQSISSLQVPFNTAFSLPISIPPGTSINIPIKFTPTDLLLYQNIFVLNTSAGNFNITLQGKGVNAAPAWSVTPANYDFGRVPRGTIASKNFIIQNTGNIPIKIQVISSPNPRFTATTNGALNLPVGGSVTMVVKFNPLEIINYSGLINIKSTTNTLPLLRAIVGGTGYVVGSAPQLEYLASSPFNSQSGVNPPVSSPGLFSYEVIYHSADSVAPRIGFPKVGIDKNNDGDFVDAGEGIYPMVKVGNTKKWISGERFAYSTTLNAGTNYGYRFFATDSLGNEASIGSEYLSGPVVTREVLDLHIYANDIVFSNLNPNVGQAFNVTATVHNNSPYSASNVDVRFYYSDSIYLFSDTIPFIDANSSYSITKSLALSPDGFYPIKVWIDSFNILGEGNILNNYASRPIIVGTFTVPGGINATASAAPAACSKGRTIFSGNANYYGLNLDGNPPVEGATVTLKIYSPDEQIYTFNTTSKGEWFFIWDPCAEDPLPEECQGPTCGIPYTYNVEITDYTLTSNLVTSTFTIPCTQCNGEGEIQHEGSISGCILENESYTYTASIANYTYDDQNRELCAPTVYKDTIEVYFNGQLSYTHILDSIKTCTDVSFTDGFAGLPVGEYSIGFSHVYYTASGERREANVSNIFKVLPRITDLKLRGIFPTGHTSFNFEDVNATCGVPVGRHTVYLYDSVVGDPAKVLIDSFIVNSVSPNSLVTLSYSNPDWSVGYHYLTIITDAKNEIAELNELNNKLTAIFYVTEPDFKVDNFTISNSALNAGSLVNFSVRVTNLGSPVTTPFKMEFKANGNALGNRINIPTLNTNESVIVVSSPFVVPSNPCPSQITAFADVERQIQEYNERNNYDTLILGANIKAGRSCEDEDDNQGAGFFNEDNPFGTILCTPFVAPRGVLTYLETTVRNTGTRDVSNIKVQFKFDGQVIGSDVVPSLRAGERTKTGFYYAFDTVGKFIVSAFADYTREICEISETDNIGNIHVDSRPSLGDLQILSQYIAPSNLNPDPNQTISVVSSIVNIGDALVPPSIVRFWVDDVQLGVDIPIDTLFPGQDTTVLATALYSSAIVGPKIIKVKADMPNARPERRENNNEATRAIIVGGAPDFANSLSEAITLSPSAFALGDSVTICNYVRNFGGDGGTAWMRFYYRGIDGVKVLIDSVRFTMLENDSFRVCKKWLVTEAAGMIITEIDHSNPPEFDTFNNIDSLPFGTIVPLKLIAFNGMVERKFASLKWKTNYEYQINHFEIERSLDGRNFAYIGLLGAHNNHLGSDYRYMDSGFAQMPNGKVFYRLKIMEADGGFKYSDIIYLTKSSIKGQPEFYPNPVRNMLNVKLEIVDPGKWNIRLLDASGRQLLNKSQMLQEGAQNLTFPMANFAKGLYLLVMQNENGEQMENKFIKE